MSKLKKLLSFTLALAILASSVFVGGITAFAESSISRTSEFFCGFENYAVTRTNESAIPSYATLATSGAYAGSKYMKLSVSANSIATFEIRDSKGFDTVTGETYAITFYYKSSAAAKYYIGTAQGSEVISTSTAIIGGDLAATNSWTKATLSVTFDKGRNEGFVPVMMVESSAVATVEFDNISLVYNNEDTVTLQSLSTEFVTSTDSYPTLSGAKTPGSAANIWDGSTATAPSGSGTQGDPYKIATGANLYWAIKNATSADRYFVLTADIYLNNPVHVNWLTGSINYGYKVRLWDVSTNAVQGHFDGQGYGVYGCYNISVEAGYRTAETAAGGYASALFGKVTDNGSLTVKNLTVDKMYIRHHAGAGGIVGTVGTTATLNLENCSVGSEVYLDGSTTGGFVAAVCTNNAIVNATNCYSLATYYSSTSTDGLIGMPHWTNPPTITFTNCYNGNGKLIGVNRNTVTATNCYESVDGPLNTGVTTLSAANMKGSDALTNASKMSGLGSAYVAHTATFEEANKNVFVRLPEGTYFEQGQTYKFNVYDANFAPFDERYVLSGSSYGTLTRGAYFRFKADFDATKVHVPVSRADEVIFGTARELHVGDYFGIRTGTIAANLKNQPESAVNYLYITDTHFQTNTSQHSDAASSRQFQLMIEMANELDEIDFVVLGGDVVSGNDAVDDDCITKITTNLEIAKTCAKPVFIIPGNHDDNSYGSIADSMTLEEFADRMLSPDEWQETVIDPFIKREQADGSFLYDIVQNKDPYNAAKTNSKYFYYDLDEKNTRVIFLNASDYEYTYDSNGKFMPYVKDASVVNARSKSYSGNNFWGYSDYQVKWLADKALGELPADYNVVIFSHMRLDKEPTNNGTRTYYNGAVLQGILTAYQNKTAYTNASLGISADFAEDTGRIMSYHHGHEHSSKTDYYSANGLNMWRLNSTTANPDDTGWKGIQGETCRVKNENIGAIEAVSVTKGYIYRQSNGIGNLSNVISQNGSGFLFNDFVVQSGDVTAEGTVDICDLVKYQLLKNAKLPAKQTEGLSLADVSVAVMDATPAAPEEPQGCKHAYDNNCDTDCNLCGEERTVGGHIYDDDYDADCNECGATREVEERPIEIWKGKENLTQPINTNSEGQTLIATAEEFAWVIKNGGKGNSYKLVADIYLNDITKINWTTGASLDDTYTINEWFTSGEASNFNGTIDGNGHVVYGLYSVTSTGTGVADGAGLIPRTSGNTAVVTIKNLGIDNAYISAVNSAGAFVGVAYQTGALTMDCCYVGEYVTITATSYAGAFRGRTHTCLGGSVTNCYSLATVTGGSGSGLFGYLWEKDNDSLIIDSCYNAKGNISTHANSSKVASTNNYMSVNTGLTEGTTVLSDAEMQTEAFAAQLGDAYVATESYPVLKVFPVKTPAEPDEPEVPDEPEECVHEYDDEYDADCNKCGEERDVPERPIVIWDGKTLTPPTKTDNDGNILISNGSELAYVIKTGGGAGNNYKLTADIYLNNLTKINWETGVAEDGYTPNIWYDEWKPNNTDADFEGNIDGDGHVIYGLYLENNPASYSAAQQGTGLIPRLKTGTSTTIKNLGIDNAYLNHANSAAAFVGVATANTTLTFEKCYAGANVTIKGGNAAVFRGNSKTVTATSLTDCYSLAETVGTVNRGLISQVYDTRHALTFTNCYNANGPIAYGTDCNIGYYALATNCYATEVSSNNTGGHVLSAGVTVKTAEELKGSAMALGDSYEVVDGGYPVLKVFPVKTPTEPDEPEVPDEPEDCVHSYDDEYDATCNKCGEEREVEERPIVIWDPSVKTTTLEGNGTQALPYLIKNGSDLAFVINGGSVAGSYYKLTADIYLNEIDKINWSTGIAENGYAPNSWFVNAVFKGGIIDGDGHVVYGLYYEGNPTSYSAGANGTALIPRLMEGADLTVKNLGLDNFYINHANTAGAFLGTAMGKTGSATVGGNIAFSNCYAGEYGTLKGGSASVFRGYAYKQIDSTSLTNCYSLATTEGTVNYGLVGSIYDTRPLLTFTNCYNATGPLGYGGNIGYYSTATNCYATEISQNTSGGHQLTAGVTIFTAEQMKGSAMTLGDAYTVVDGGYPVLKVFPVKTPVTPDEPECEHSYDNACDINCNLCGEERDVEDHVYSNACDVDCNECGATRTPSDHVYDDEKDTDCNECGAIRVLPDTPSDFDDTLVKEYLDYQSDKSANYLFVTSESDLAIAEKIANENDEIDFIVLSGINATLNTSKPVIVFDGTNKYLDITGKKIRVILLGGSADADMSWFVNTALSCADGWNYIVVSDEVVAGRPANGVIGDADQTLWKILYDYQNKNYYLNEGLGIDEDWTQSTSKIIAYHLVGAEAGYSYRDDVDLWMLSSDNLNIFSGNKNIVFRFDVELGNREYMISNFAKPEGDLNIDGLFDIADLVKLALIENGSSLPAGSCDRLDQTTLRSMLFGDVIYLPDYYQALAADKADEVNEYLANASDNTAVYLYWTDAHWNRNYENSYKLLQYMAQTTPVTHTIFGGDVANDDDPTADDINEWRELSLRLPNHHSVVGNHEYTSPHLPVEGNRAQTYSNIYNFLLAPEFEQSGVTNSLGENELCYYVDNEAEKTRYMFLKCSRGPESGVTYEEFKWAVESLNSTPAGWHIVMIGHEWLNGTSYAQNNSRAFGRLADAYNAREVGTTDFFSVAYDFTDAAATVEYLIGGDNHTDIDNAKSAGQIPVITLETDCVRGEPTAIGGTISENCVNVVIADYDNNTIKVVRIGRDEDMNMAMAPNGKISSQVTQDITDVDGQYITDYIDLSKPKINNYKSRNDAYLLISGGSTTPRNYVVEFYNYDSATGAYNVSSSYNVTLGSGSWQFRAGETPVTYTYPVVYDIRDGDMYVDLTAVAFRHKNTPANYPQYARIKYTG
ncbi:MAG: metallophosphoesterase, partial [Clostridia bacterium]|nr:metallophosphoesterase [Clostridia bacterium]